ncbi:MAG: hypothetical protein GSR77_08165 [Desulfurococcales archaeon]|nr:hypothetical protein [Desulfurococcales archaeon]
MNPLPLIIVILPLLLVYSTAMIYRSIYPREAIEKAIEVISQYRVLKNESRKSKRILKKLRAMESEYKKAKRIMTRSIIVKMLLLMASYVSGSIIFFYIVPVLPAPYYIPLISIESEFGLVIPSFLLYFISYMVFYLAMRDTFL